jgi:hypothetical protein
MLGAIWKRWHWLDDGLLPLAATVSYAAWAYPVFAVYVRDPAAGTRAPGFTFWLCLGILLSGTIAGRLASQSRRGAAIVIGGGIASVLACLLLIVPSSAAEVRAWPASPLFLPTVIAGMVCAILLWWRGVRLAQADHHEETSWTFVVGALALACLLFVSHMHHDARSAQAIASTLWILAFLALIGVALFLVMLSLLRVLDERVLLSGGETVLACAAALLTAMLPVVPPPGELSGPFLLFVAFGLTTRSLLGVSWVLNNQRGRGGVRLHVDRNWLVVMLGAVLGVVSLGLLVGEILTPDAVRSAWGWVRPVLALLAGIVALVVLAVLLFALWLVRLIAPGFRFRLPEITLPSAEELGGLGERTLELAPSLKQTATILLILAVLSLVAWILYRAARRLHLGAWAHVDTTEDRDQVLSWQLLLRQLRDVLHSLRERGSSPFVGLGPLGSARRAIRKVYQKVLGRAIALGTPREKGQTPGTYGRTLSDLAPEAQASLETLTSAYETARYGAVPPTREQAKGAEEAFVDIDSALRAEAKRRASQVDLSDADPHTRS